MNFYQMKTSIQLSTSKKLRLIPRSLKWIASISKNQNTLKATLWTLRRSKPSQLAAVKWETDMTFWTSNVSSQPQVIGLWSRSLMIVCSGPEKILLVFQLKKYGKRWRRSTVQEWLHSKPFKSFRTPFMIGMSLLRLLKRPLGGGTQVIQDQINLTMMALRALTAAGSVLLNESKVRRKLLWTLKMRASIILRQQSRHLKNRSWRKRLLNQRNRSPWQRAKCSRGRIRPQLQGLPRAASKCPLAHFRRRRKWLKPLGSSRRNQKFMCIVPPAQWPDTQ